MKIFMPKQIRKTYKFYIKTYIGYIHLKDVLSICRSSSLFQLFYAFAISAGVENPPLPVVQKFVHLLDQRANDFAEEIGSFVLLDVIAWKCFWRVYCRSSTAGYKFLEFKPRSRFVGA